MNDNMDDFVVYSPSDINDTAERSSPVQRSSNDSDGGDGANHDHHRQRHHHHHHHENHAPHRSDHRHYRDYQSNGEHSRPPREHHPYDRNSSYPQRRERESPPPPPSPPGQDGYHRHHRPPHHHHHHVDNEYRGDGDDYRRPRRESPPPPPPAAARRDRDGVDRGRQRQQRRPAAPLSAPSSTLVIKNMPTRVTEREIADTFSTLPGFRECARRSSRWGHGVYIEFDTVDSAEKAFHSVQSTRFHGQRNPLNVDYHGSDTTGSGMDRHNSLKRRHDDPSRIEERRPEEERYKEDVGEPSRYKRRSASPPTRSDVDDKRRDGILPEPRSSERDHSHHRPSIDQAGHARRDISEPIDRHQHYHSRPSYDDNMRRDARNDDRRYDGRDNEMRYVERRRSDDDGPPIHEHSMGGRYARDRRPPYPDHFSNAASPMQYGTPPGGPTVNRDGDLIHRLVSHVMPYRSFDEYADVVGMIPTRRPTTLYVCNIPQDIREREIYLFFCMSLPFPAVKSVRMVQNSKSKWIAFVDFSEYHAAMMAMHKLNGYVMDRALPEGIKIDLDTKSK